MANVSRDFIRIQDPIMTVNDVGLKQKFAQNYLNKNFDSARGNLISIFSLVGENHWKV